MVVWRRRMAGKRKRKSGGERRAIHHRNKYADNPPDFALLASLYPSFEPYVFYSRDGRPRIDWTDFNATRELTRVLLLHDHGVNWWIPDGQLCPTVPNRLNYIHWIEDLLALDILPATRAESDITKGFDIGTGANCIYPLLGASVLGWKFVGSDITDIAIEWANKNVESNPHLSHLIDIRRAGMGDERSRVGESQNHPICSSEGGGVHLGNPEAENVGSLALSVLETQSNAKDCDGPPVLLVVVKDGENFDFCMCNPPFFETIEEAGMNPKTSCGGTPEEMVCSGGEHTFITRIIEDSVMLKDTFRWYSSMVGRKLNLNILVSKLWKVGATVVKTTEFVQGRTSRWGLAWSFLPVSRKISSHNVEENNMSFMLEGLQHRHGAFHVLQSVESYLSSNGASSKLDAAAFNVDITVSRNQIDAILKSETCDLSNSSNDYHSHEDSLCFRITVFQQHPGALLVRGKLLERSTSISGMFSLIFRHLEEVLAKKFCPGRVLVNQPSPKE
ncbi:uncharacterized protein LOC130989331 [Salvia miltiorrhiza]|uniref:uncharacterized protein LOC130989331 n=1 Tax=Salvia miltiorrhiza TaxID=226208 RepID=UPI0025AD0D25|nr:uncharacterized protein LOC130989331 [Salvia miltiorrhiza]